MLLLDMVLGNLLVGVQYFHFVTQGLSVGDGVAVAWPVLWPCGCCFYCLADCCVLVFHVLVW